MKTNGTSSRTWMFVFGFLLSAPAAWSQAALKTGGSLWIDGDTNVHHFASTTTVVQASLAPEQAALSLADLGQVKKGLIKGFDLSVAITDLKSGEKGLDKNMYKALKSEANPTIVFHMKSYEVVPSIETAGLTLKAEGTLSIAGARKTVQLTSRVASSGGGLRLTGLQTILMSDYGVTPPTFLFGAMKVKDRVVVGYDLVIAPLGDKKQ